MNRLVLTEMDECFCQLDTRQVQLYVDAFVDMEYKNIVGLGAGRMGYALRGFIMRLNHLGIFNSVTMIGDTDVPRITDKSLVLVNSSSGETPSIVLLTKQAYDVNATILTTTGNTTSTIARLSNEIIELPSIQSKQLMKSVYEQFSMLLYDTIILEIVDYFSLETRLISENHSILE